MSGQGDTSSWYSWLVVWVKVLVVFCQNVEVFFVVFSFTSS